MTYSDAELRLIEHLGFFEFAENPGVSPTALYMLMASRAFIDDYKGPAVEALRKACRALQNMSCYRETKEWDELISF